MINSNQKSDMDEIENTDLIQQIRIIYLDYFRELPQNQQATARAFCYFFSIKKSAAVVPLLKTTDDELDVIESQYESIPWAYIT